MKRNPDKRAIINNSRDRQHIPEGSFIVVPEEFSSQLNH